MKIIIEKYGSKQKYESLEQYAERRLDGGDHGKGAMGATADTATNNSKAIGRLLELLAIQGSVSAEGAVIIVEGLCLPGEAKFKK